jgi:hypothetical protein
VIGVIDIGSHRPKRPFAMISALPLASVRHETRFRAALCQSAFPECSRLWLANLHSSGIVPPMKTDKTPGHARLIGRAGVALAMFHFGRLGHEFVPTQGDSAAGDLWVDFGDGPVAVEVKTVFGRVWGLRRSQLERVKFVVFVCAKDGGCWMLEASRLLEIFAHCGESMMVKDTRLERLNPRELHRELLLFRRVHTTDDDYVPGAKGWRTVRYKLKNGEVRERVYRRRASR